jgi:hypothetical protein
MCNSCKEKAPTDITLTLSKAPFIMHIGFLSSEEDAFKTFDFQIDMELDMAPFFKEVTEDN